MGKKRYNWKARNVSDIEIDNTETRKVFLLKKNICNNNNFPLFLFLTILQMFRIFFHRYL